MVEEVLAAVVVAAVAHLLETWTQTHTQTRTQVPQSRGLWHQGEVPRHQIVTAQLPYLELDMLLTEWALLAAHTGLEEAMHHAQVEARPPDQPRGLREPYHTKWVAHPPDEHRSLREPGWCVPVKGTQTQHRTVREAEHYAARLALWRVPPHMRCEMRHSQSQQRQDTRQVLYKEWGRWY